MVDQREGLLGETALAGRQKRIKQPLARSPGYRHDAHEWKTLVTDNVGIAHHNTGPHAMLLVTECGVKFHHHDCAAAELHSRPSTQPSPGIHRTSLTERPCLSSSFPCQGRQR